MESELENIKILGAYGTKSKGYGTSSFLLNKSNVIDAGNLIDSLDIATTDIENIWITHAHLDHIVDIAYILDNYFSQRKKTLTLIGLRETLDVIKKCFLNDMIWPDFSKIALQDSDVMAVNYRELELGKEYKIAENEYIRAFQTDHTIESCGYIYKRDASAVMITADTHSLENALNILENDMTIHSLVVECSFPNALEDLAITSKHLTPNLLFKQLNMLKREDLNIYINHLKPSFIEKISDEISDIDLKHGVKILSDGDLINF